MDATSPTFVPTMQGQSHNGHPVVAAQHDGDHHPPPNAGQAHPHNHPASQQGHSSSKHTQTGGNHARSHSVPGGNYSSRGRGAPSSRARGGSRGTGRGGARGGSHASQIPVKRPPLPPPQPSVHLDSVAEFPALGGSSVPHSATSGSTPTSTSTPSSASSNAGTEGSDAGRLSRESSDLSKEGMGKEAPVSGMKPSISFARIVAPTPPASKPATPESSSMKPNSSQDRLSSARSDDGGSQRSRRTSHAGQGKPNQAPPMHADDKSMPSAERDVLAFVPPHHIERPHFEPNHPPPFQQQQAPSPAQPTLTPTQIAFLQANGIAVDGLPNAPPAAAEAQPFPEYYPPQEHSSLNGNGQQAGPSGNPQGQTKPLTKAEKKARKLQRDWEAQQQAEWQQQMLAQQQHYYDYPQQQQYGPGFEGEAHHSAQFEQDGAGSQGMTKSHSMSSFHLSPSASVFQPHHHELNVAAPVFQPKSPVLDGADAPFAHEEPVPEEQVKKQDDPAIKQAVKEANEDIPDSADRVGQDLPNGTSQEAYKEDEQPKEGLKAEDMPNLKEEGAEVLEAATEAEAVPEEASDEKETQSQVTDAVTATQDVAKPLENAAGEGEPTQAVIDKADASIPDRNDRVDLPAGHSQEAYGEAEAPKLVNGEEVPIPEDGGVDSFAPALGESTSAADPGRTEADDGAEVLSASGEEEAIPEQAGKEDQAIEQLADPTNAVTNEDPEGIVEESSAETELQAPESAGSPPHSTFSLLPPVSVDDILDKAKELVGLDDTSKTEAEDSSEAAARHDGETNGDEESVLATAAGEEQTHSAESSTVEDVKANLDELDLSVEEPQSQPNEPAHSTQETLSNLDELDIPDGDPSVELPSPSHSQDLSSASLRTENDESKHSLSPSEVEQGLMNAGAEGGHTLNEELAIAGLQGTAEAAQQLAIKETSSPSVQETRQQPYEVVSSSEERCTVEQSGDADAHDRSIRSLAPSPQIPTSSLPEATSSKPTRSSDVPPVIVSPSSPAAVDDVTSQEKQGEAARPTLARQATEAEKAEAIRIVAESRSEPPTPAAAEDNAAETSFKFDLPAHLTDGQSSKRKRGVLGEKEDEDADVKEQKDEAKKAKHDEAPSLTLSIFSGSILPRKQLVMAVLASVGINLFLPFVNGVMLGFGEIIARDWIGPIFGFGRRRAANEDAQSSRFSTSGLGLRSAGSKTRGGAQDVPGHAAAKTLLENATETAVSGSPI